ncbi:MAG: DUF72 domain-containing protein [Thermodesulfobacteriota bacterium]|nr:MAG: DUF72 domain-containing protein [Thermodesulfobacteriota bacterium]
MPPEPTLCNPEAFKFRGLHSKVFMGTASDRYAGWIGQIYSPGRFDNRKTHRTHKVGKQSFKEEVLPVESVEEYFDHFAVLEIDYTFYRPLLDKDGKPTDNYHILKQYRNHLNKNDRFILKVPQIISAQKIRQGVKFLANEEFLNPKVFIDQFYQPANDLLGSNLTGFIFEQEYQRKDERVPVIKLASALDTFFQAIPPETRYHIELRTETYLTNPVFEVLEKHGVGQVLSHWTWLPSLKKQWLKSGGRFFNKGKEAIIRLMTPIGLKYEDAYAQAFPFNKLVEGLMQNEMIEETVELMKTGIKQGIRINIIINNRAGGNAPMIARQVAKRFLFPEKNLV